MTSLKEILGGLDALLEVKRIPDYSNNGLQIEGRASVGKVAFAVDACLESIQKAAEVGADLLIVHHGLFWGQPLMLSGTHRERVVACLDAGLSLYAVHLPLDVHPVYGNNVGILEDAGFKPGERFAESKGLAVGYLGDSPGIRLDAVISSLKASLGVEPFRILNPREPASLITRAAAITGSGLRYASEAAALGAELYLSGEGSHSAYHEISESGITCLLYGHYQSETIGLKRLMGYLDQTWGLKTVFLDLPTGF